MHNARPILICILLFTVFITYSPCLSHFFAGDELWALRTYGWNSFGELLKKTISLHGAHHWRPVYNLCWALNIKLLGLNPFAYNLWGVLIQALNTILVFTLLKFSFGKTALAFWTSLIFSTHYLSSLWVFEQGQNDQQLLVFFYALTIILLLYHEVTQRKSSQLLSISFFLCALLSREMALTTILSFPFWLIAYEDSETHISATIWRRYWLHLLRLKYYFLILAGYLCWRLLYIGVAPEADEGWVYTFYFNPMSFIRHFPIYIHYTLYRRDIRNLTLFFSAALTTIIAMCHCGNTRAEQKYFAVPLFSVLPLAAAVFICPLIIPALLQPPNFTALWHLSLSILGMSMLYAAFLDTTLNILAPRGIMRYGAIAIIYFLIVSFPIISNRRGKDYWPKVNSAALEYILTNKIKVPPNAVVLIKGIETESAFEDSNFRDFFKLYWGNSLDVNFLPSNAPTPAIGRSGTQLIVFKFENNRLRLAE